MILGLWNRSLHQQGPFMGVLQDCIYGERIYDYANYANCPSGGTYFRTFHPAFRLVAAI